VPKVGESHGRNELVSIIVTTKNADRTLERCLRSLRAQSYGNTETIVVDNFSEDRTEEIAHRFADKFSKAGPERSSQRNLGAKLASGGFFLFVDADMEPTSHVVEDCLSHASRHHALIIPEKTVGSNWLARVRSVERDAYQGSFLFEAARFVNREVFESLGGYDTRLTGLEDYDFEARLEERGFLVGRTNELILHHEGDNDFVHYLRKRIYYAQGFPLYRSLHPIRARKQFGLSRAMFLLKKADSSPLAVSMVFTLKALEFAAAKESLALARLGKDNLNRDVYRAE